MELESAYYWPGEGLGIGMLLQEYRFKKEGTQLLGICLLQGEDRDCERFGDEFGRLFHGQILKDCEKGRGIAERPVRDFLKKAQAETVSFGGVIIFGEEFLLFGRGSVRIGVMNMRFNRENLKLLQGTEEGFLQGGMLESGTGIAFLTESLPAVFSEKELKECLSVRELERGAPADRRLNELAKEAGRRGRRDVGVVLLVARESAGTGTKE